MHGALHDSQRVVVDSDDHRVECPNYISAASVNNIGACSDRAQSRFATTHLFLTCDTWFAAFFARVCLRFIRNTHETFYFDRFAADSVMAIDVYACLIFIGGLRSRKTHEC